MADDAPSSEIQINVKGPSELKLQITIKTDKTVLELKQAIAAKSDVEADRQRLIYSGRVLKDEDALSVYKIQSSHTIHMVKGTARAGPSASQQPAALPTMQTGQNPQDPLTQLNSHQGYGLMAGLNPFADMGLNPNDPNMLSTMMGSPQFLQHMSSVLSNPAILDQIIASSPQLAAMEPRVREIFQSEQFRQMISNPESMRAMLQMASMFHDNDNNSPFAGGFPAPGVPSSQTASTTPAGQISAPDNANLAALASLFSGAAGGGGGGGGFPPLPPLQPGALQQIMAGMPGAPATSAPPTDARPPEERFQVQLQQLQEMGFMNASQNVRALLATAGNVHAAIEYILGGGGM